MDRAERRERWLKRTDARALALVGAALSVAVALVPSLPLRTACFALSFAAAWLAGRKTSPLATILTMAGIVAANLLVPVGKVLVALGPLRVTETALLEGIEKAVTFETLIFVSKACISPELRLPGKAGAFFAEAFRVYERFAEHKASIRPKFLFADIDAILLSVYHQDTDAGSPHAGNDDRASEGKPS